MASESSFWQSFVNEDIPQMRLRVVQENDITSEIIDQFIVPSNHRQLGLAPGYAANGRLTALAIASDDAVGVLLVTFSDKSKDGRTAAAEESADAPDLSAGRRLLEDRILCRPDGELYAFTLGPLALSLYTSHHLHISNAIDIQSTLKPNSRTGHPLESIRHAMKMASKPADCLWPDNIIQSYDQVIYDSNSKEQKYLAARAWIAFYVSQLPALESSFQEAPRVCTKTVSEGLLNLLAKVSHDALRLDQQKPTSFKHDLKIHNAGQEVQVSSNRYQNKFKPRSKNQRVNVHVDDFSVKGINPEVEGKNAVIGMENNIEDRNIKSITTIGRDDPTSAEYQKSLRLLHVLQGQKGLFEENPWIQHIWNSSSNASWPSASPSTPSSTPTIRSLEFGRPINDSQLEAIQSMLSTSDKTRITLIQGPPGTGKTSVIATFVQSAIKNGQTGLWLVAQSNVAVKNIAEKLLDYGFSKFKLLVSSDFHDDWHEHLYAKIPHNVVRSAEFGSKKAKPQQSCQVILCTLSMLSNPRILSCGFTTVVPIRTLVVDEASQIEIGNYIPALTTFASTLQKLCFIGDDKQLPPYGQEELQDLQSIFEVPHLRQTALLLNVQYRMPPQLGEFISDAVYDGQLQSNPLHPITAKITACHFLDLPDSLERSSNTSWINASECEAIMFLAEYLQSKNSNFRIITPYEAQRALLQESLKENGLNWEDKCFNVDSFQGNEEDYIIISLVRTKGLGFLNDLRRNNVMLSRCKRGMFIVSNYKFLTGIAAETMVGRLLAYYGEIAWLQPEDLETVPL